MTSKTQAQDASSTSPAAEATGETSIKTKRHATVYDAVAGRISANGFIPSIPLISKKRDTTSSNAKAVPPEAVLFRRRNAPTRYEESDSYFASDDLPSGALPDSDLIKALHCYSADFYARATDNGGMTDWRSMDETALLALGILMEELGRESLGERGDLVFTEGVGEGEEGLESSRGETDVIEASAAAVRSGRSRRGKRRRLDVEDSDQSMH